MPVSVFPKALKQTKARHLQSTALRGFGGGLNAVDDDLSMANKYLKTLVNTIRSPSGSQIVRFGEQWFADIANQINSPIVDMVYFNARLIAVTQSGNIVTIDDAGNTALIWSHALASKLLGSPAGWYSGVTQVSFVPFKNTLIIHNGRDKPISIDSGYNVTYLQDLGSGSNVNVPIGLYGCVASNYHCVAGFPNTPTQIVISAKGTAGTFVGDPAPNDSISIDIGAYAPEGAAQIRGIAGFKSFLIVFLQGIFIQVQLGNYNASGAHVPSFPDTFPKFGLLGQRCITTIENDLIFGGLDGLGDAKRTFFSASLLASESVSNVIDPIYRKTIGSFTDSQLLTNTFSVYDKLTRSFILAFPDGTGLVYTSNQKLKYQAWSTWSNWAWNCACASFLGRVFMAKGTRIYKMGNFVFGERYYAGKLLDRDYTWTTSKVVNAGDKAFDPVTNKSYTAGVSHTTGKTTLSDDLAANPTWWTLYQGDPISFELELPWFDGRDPMQVKHLRYLSIGTKGTAEFTVELYVDNLYKDYYGNKLYNPVTTMRFRGNDFLGYGYDADTFGGGRLSKDARLWKFPADFKMAKFRIIGSTREPLEIISLAFLFVRGRYIRR